MLEDSLRDMAASPAYAMRRGVLIDAAQRLEQLQNKNESMQLTIDIFKTERDLYKTELMALKKWLHGDCKACKHKERIGGKECLKCSLGSTKYKWEFIESLNSDKKKEDEHE